MKDHAKKIANFEKKNGRKTIEKIMDFYDEIKRRIIKSGHFGILKRAFLDAFS